MDTDWEIGDVKELQSMRNGTVRSTAISICKDNDGRNVRFELLGGVRHLQNGMFLAEPWQYLDEGVPMKSRQFSTYRGAFEYVLGDRDHNRKYQEM